MEDKPAFRPFLFPMLLMMLGGWGGLLLLLNFTVPTVWPRWGVFALVILAGTGTVLPVAFWLNIFLPVKAAPLHVVVRQSVFVGVYLALLLWLQIGRILNLSIIIWLGLGVAAIEYLIRLRELSTTPPDNNAPPESAVG